MGEITDTAKTDTLLLLAEAMFEKRPGGHIEDMERRGGQEMLQATHTLPTDGSDHPDVQALPIRWGEVLEADPIFREAWLPDGWTRVDGEHQYGYWTYLHDETGRERARVFYKAAYYDRKATIYATRYCGECDHYAHLDACETCGHEGKER